MPSDGLNVGPRPRALAPAGGSLLLFEGMGYLAAGDRRRARTCWERAVNSDPYLY